MKKFALKKISKLIIFLFFLTILLFLFLVLKRNNITNFQILKQIIWNLQIKKEKQNEKNFFKTEAISKKERVKGVQFYRKFFLELRDKYLDAERPIFEEKIAKYILKNSESKLYIKSKPYKVYKLFKMVDSWQGTTKLKIDEKEEEFLRKLDDQKIEKDLFFKKNNSSDNAKKEMISLLKNKITFLDFQKAFENTFNNLVKNFSYVEKNLNNFIKRLKKYKKIFLDNKFYYFENIAKLEEKAVKKISSHIREDWPPTNSDREKAKQANLEQDFMDLLYIASQKKYKSLINPQKTYKQISPNEKKKGFFDSAVNKLLIGLYGFLFLIGGFRFFRKKMKK